MGACLREISYISHTRYNRVHGQTPSNSRPLAEFSKAMHLYYGDPVSHLNDQRELEKLNCTQGSPAAFTAFTRKHQQLQMRLGDYDTRSIEQHVRHCQVP